MKTIINTTNKNLKSKNITFINPPLKFKKELDDVLISNFRANTKIVTHVEVLKFNAYQILYLIQETYKNLKKYNTFCFTKNQDKIPVSFRIILTTILKKHNKTTIFL